MEKEKPLSKEEKQGQREVAIKNLQSNSLMSLASAYFVESDSNYGEADSSAVEQFEYFPAINKGVNSYSKEGQENDLIRNSLLSSRQDGKRYSGSVSEYSIIKESSQIILESIMSLKVEDVVNQVGYDSEIKEKYKDKYLSDLSESKDEESKKVGQSLIISYVNYLKDMKVSNALKERANSVKGGLEKILKPEPENKGGKE